MRAGAWRARSFVPGENIDRAARDSRRKTSRHSRRDEIISGRRSRRWPSRRSRPRSRAPRPRLRSSPPACRRERRPARFGRPAQTGFPACRRKTQARRREAAKASCATSSTFRSIGAANNGPRWRELYDSRLPDRQRCNASGAIDRPAAPSSQRRRQRRPLSCRDWPCSRR